MAGLQSPRVGTLARVDRGHQWRTTGIVSHSGLSRPNPLKTKARHSQPPGLQETPVLLCCRTKNIRPSEKALSTRHKVFCREPPRSLTTSITVGGDCGQSSRLQRNKCNRMQHEIEKHHRITTLVGQTIALCGQPPAGSVGRRHKTMALAPEFPQPRNVKRNFS
jgi:hypothetical protein